MKLQRHSHKTRSISYCFWCWRFIQCSSELICEETGCLSKLNCIEVTVCGEKASKRTLNVFTFIEVPLNVAKQCKKALKTLNLKFK